MPFLVPTQVVTALSVALGTAVGFPPLQGGVVAAAIWPLINNLLASQGTSVPITYTRAGSLATIEDFEGILRKLPANDAPPFVGSRLVVNEIENPNDLEAANWSAPGDGQAVINSASRVTYNGTANGRVLDSAFLSLSTGESVIVSFECRVISGNPSLFTDVQVALFGSGLSTTHAYCGDVVDSTWQKFSSAAKTASSDVSVSVSIICEVAAVLEFRNIQTEKTTGQAYQLPAKFVDPYEYFTYENASIITGFALVTEIIGDDISASILNGLPTERAGTNEIIQSNALDTSWTQLGTCAVAQTGSNLGEYGALWELDSNAPATGDGLRPSTDTTIISGSVNTYSFYVEVGDSTQCKVEVALTLGAAPVTPDVLINWSGGVPTLANSGTAFTKKFVETTEKAGVYRISLVYDDASTNTNAQLRLFPDNIGLGNKSHFGYVQIEKGVEYSTSYIHATTSGGINRAIAKATLPANRLPLSNLTLYMEIDWKAKLRDVEHRFLEHLHATLSSWMQFDIAANNKFLFAWKNNGFASANATSTTLSPTSDGVLKIAATQSVDDGIRFYINGSLEAAMTLTTAAAKAELNTIGAELLYIGSSKALTKHCDTPIKDFRIYPRVLDQSDAEALTTL